MRSPSVRHRVGVLLALFLACVVGSGCGGDDGPAASEPPSTTTPSTEPSTTLSPEAADERALRQLAEEWFEAVRRIFVDGEDPTLAEQYITGEYLEEFRQHVAEDAAAGHRTERDPQGRTRTTIEEISVSGDQGVITECVVNADVLIDASGQVLDDSVGVRRYTTTAQRTGDEWRLAQRTSTTLEGVESCA